MSTKTIQPTLQLPAVASQSVPLVERQMTVLVERLSASDRAKRISLTNESAAACSERLTNIVRKLGTAKDASMATIPTVTMSSTSVKPFWRSFIRRRVPRTVFLGQKDPTFGATGPPDGRLGASEN